MESEWENYDELLLSILSKARRGKDADVGVAFDVEFYGKVAGKMNRLTEANFTAYDVAMRTVDHIRLFNSFKVRFYQILL